MDKRSQYLASQAPRRRRTHPARSAQALNTSGAGIVHRNMMDLQRQPNLNKADTARLKDLRRDWNRNRKYTDAGMAIAGASNQLDAQKYFRDTTEDFRQTNKPAYAKMYPLTNLAMEYPQKGGLLGMFLSEIGGKTLDKVKDFGSSLKDGITSALDDTPDEQADYAAKTFGFYPSDVHPGQQDLTPEIRPEISMEFGEPYTSPIKETLLYDENLVPNIAPFIDKNTRNEVFAEDVDDLPVNTINNTRTIPGLIIPQPLENQDDFVDERIEGMAPPKVINEPLPFDDSGRETGIASMYGQGPQWGETDRIYEDEYRDFIANQSDTMRQFGPVTYEEFADMYERIHQGKPHAGLR
jgi:hypothetical protein